ncbi:MAG: PTS sugar transporter subunit IIA [Symbiobacteriia bacterium]
MVGIVLVSHGALADGLVAAAQMIMGPQAAMEAVGLTPAENMDDFLEKLRRAVAAVEQGQGALVLVDLFGGSPGNTAAYLAQAGVEVVTGMNLPMLLEVLGSRDEMPPKELADVAMAAGREGVHRLAELF